MILGETICPDCGKDLGRWAGFIHMANGEWCGEGTADVVAGYIWSVFGINLSEENIERMATEISKNLNAQLIKTIEKVLNDPTLS